jgi:hypothetical protein
MKLPHADPTGFYSFMQQLVRMRYGAKGTWGHGRYAHATKKGPGRRRLPLSEQNRPAWSKLYRKAMESKYGVEWKQYEV